MDAKKDRLPEVLGGINKVGRQKLKGEYAKMTEEFTKLDAGEKKRWVRE